MWNDLVLLFKKCRKKSKQNVYNFVRGSGEKISIVYFDSSIGIFQIMLGLNDDLTDVILIY